MVRSREVAFEVGTGDLTRGCINVQLLVVARTGRPIGKEFSAEGLRIKFEFPCGTKDAFPVSFI